MGNWAFLVAFQSTRKGGLLKRGGEGLGHVFSQIACFLGGAAIPHRVLAHKTSVAFVQSQLEIPCGQENVGESKCPSLQTSGAQQSVLL